MSENLIQTPPYFYWKELPFESKPVFYHKLLLHILNKYDLDLSLLMHMKFLDRVHQEFYRRVVNKEEEVSVKPVMR